MGLLVINVIVRPNFYQVRVQKQQQQQQQQQMGDLLLSLLASLHSFDGEYGWRVKLIMKT